MNFVNDTLDPCCESCGDTAPVESMQLYRYEMICPTCLEDHEAATAIAEADEFQARSYEWFTELSAVALERKSASYEDCDYDTPSLQEQYQASFGRVA